MPYPSTAKLAAMTAKVEATPGTFETLSTSTDGVLLLTDLAIKTTFGKLSRGLVKAYFNGDETLPGFPFVELSFSVELGGSGTAGTAPAWGKFLRASGFAEAITAVTKVDYTPVSSGIESMSAAVYYAGIRRSFRCLRVASMELMAEVNTTPKMRFTMVGIEATSDFDVVAMIAPTLTMWKKPAPVSYDGQSVQLGASYNNSTGAFTGGTQHPSKGLRLTITNECTARPVLGWTDYTPITGRTITATVSFDLTPTNREAFYDACKAGTLQSLAQAIGSTTGGIVRLFMPATELMDLTDEDDAGLQFDQWQFAVRPSIGNDDLRIVAL